MKFRNDYWFLSNFYPVQITYKGLTYPTAEHAYQAAKTSKNHEKLAIIRLAKTPGKAKRAGRSVTLKKNWEKIKLKVMEDILRVKFSYAHLRLLLVIIEDEITEENDWGDTFWGVCRDKHTGRLVGQNHLGKILTKIRDELVEE